MALKIVAYGLLLCLCQQVQNRVFRRSNNPLGDPLSGLSCDSFAVITNSWGSGAEGRIKFTVPEAVSSWKISIEFQDSPINQVNVDNSESLESDSGCRYAFQNYNYNGNIAAGSMFDHRFQYSFNYNMDPKPSIAYIEFISGTDKKTCGVPACIPSTTGAPQPTSTDSATTDSSGIITPLPVDPLSGATCSNFVQITQSGPGSSGGKMIFYVPNELSPWTLKIGFNPAFNSFHVQQGAHIQSNENVCGGNIYSYIKSDSLITQAGSVVELPYFMNYDQNAMDEPPVIAYIYIGDGANSYSCGAEPSCVSTTSTTGATSETSNPSGSSTTTTTTTTTTMTTSTTTLVPTTTTATTSTSAPTITPTTTTTTIASPTTKTTTTEISTITTQQPSCQLPHDLKVVLSKSIEFYKAQRTGVLPDSDIPWRRDSFTNDGLREGVDLSGGYVDAGDFMKFNFPAAAATTILAWGMLKFGEGYKFAGLHNEGSATLKWATDYFIKCHTGPNELWGQCGIGGEDHGVWGREDEYYTLSGKANPRPCFKIDQSKPGSDLAGETAAALAATSMVFKDINSTYSETLLQHARQLYDFAKDFTGKYSDSITDAANFYKSYSGYIDELAWSASWLYKATGEAAYLTDAENFYNSMQQNAPEFSWDNKGRGVAILLSQLSNNAAKYQTNADDFCNQMKDSQTRTKRGIVFIQEWGSNRHAANVAFVCLVHSNASGGQFNNFARDQINKMLGDESKMERSYVVGYGFMPPTQPHHRPSSCPTRPAPCGWNEYNLNSPNPQILNGGLVGGVRSIYEDYTDSRQDYVRNEVALDYNAGFQSAVAGLLSLQQAGDCGAGES